MPLLEIGADGLKRNGSRAATVPSVAKRAREPEALANEPHDGDEIVEFPAGPREQDRTFGEKD